MAAGRDFSDQMVDVPRRAEIEPFLFEQGTQSASLVTPVGVLLIACCADQRLVKLAGMLLEVPLLKLYIYGQNNMDS